MEIKKVTLFSPVHYAALALREEVLGSKPDLELEEKLTVFVAILNGQVIGHRRALLPQQNIFFGGFLCNAFAEPKRKQADKQRQKQPDQRVNKLPNAEHIIGQISNPFSARQFENTAQRWNLNKDSIGDPYDRREKQKPDIGDRPLEITDKNH